MMTLSKRWHVSIVGLLLLFMTNCAFHSVKQDSTADQGLKYGNCREQKGWLLVENHPTAIQYKVLLLPGLLCTDLIYSDLLNDRNLADAGVKLIAANPPGFKGIPAKEGFDYSVESYAKEIESLSVLESFDLIVGHSFFGNVLIEVAARKNYSGKLILISPSLFRDAEGIDTRAMDHIGHIPLLGTFTMWASYQIMESFFEPYMTAEKQDWVKPMVAEARKTPPDVARRLVISFFDYIDQYGDLTERLTSAKTPVWYVRGDQDNIILSEEDRSRLKKSNNVIVKDIPEGKHFIMIDRPSEISDLIFNILSCNRASSFETPCRIVRRDKG
jgi:pimeloyl-ACP methyl ester carboxylesterase